MKRHPKDHTNKFGRTKIYSARKRNQKKNHFFLKPNNNNNNTNPHHTNTMMRRGFHGLSAVIAMGALPKEEKKGESREEMVERGMKEKGSFSKVDSSRFELLQVQV